MPNIYSTCNWNMTAAQLVTPTSSALSTVNAIQAAITASTHWMVNSTGTTTTGYKYVEVKPSNLTSIYKDYRILFVERVNNSTNKNFAGTTPFNSATAVPVYFAPDGGSSWSTFTPANIDTANPPYVGSRYRWGTSTSGLYQWTGIYGAWTAIWLYECEGGLWLINRSGVTSHQIMAIGSVFVPSRASLTDFNEAGTEVGLPGVWTTTGLAAASITGSIIVPAASTTYIWYQTAAGSPPTKSTLQGTGSATMRGLNNATSLNAGNKAYYTSEAGLIASPIQFYFEVSSTANAGNSAFVLRGVYLMTNMQTRTTIQTGSPATTIGYTFFPDDTTLASTSFALAFMNTP